MKVPPFAVDDSPDRTHHERYPRHVSRASQVNELGGRVTIVGHSPRVRTVFDLVGLSQMLNDPTTTDCPQP